jgi:hypothetical protein
VNFDISLSFNSSLIDKKHQLPFLWRTAESYLHVGQHSYRVSAEKAQTVRLAKTNSKPFFVTTLLKLASFATIVFPLIAVAVKWGYRNTYKLEILKDSTIHQLPQSHVSISPSLQQAIDDFKREYKEDILCMFDKNSLAKIYTEYQPQENIDPDHISQKLNDYLKNIDSYLQSQEEVLVIVYSSLQNLINQPGSLALAKQVYKKIAAFLRKETDKKYLEDYIHYLEKGGLFNGTICLKPSGYLLDNCQDITIDQLNQQAALFYLLKQLRKQIKLKNPHKIQNKLTRQAVLTKEALDYLNIMWLHGTKAFAIHSACTTSDGNLLPAGALKKRKIEILTGEMQIGATAGGINQNSLSGVNLDCAQQSIEYANKFQLNEKDEEELCDNFLKNSFNDFRDFLNDYGMFSRSIEAVKRLQKCNPTVFVAKKNAFVQKLKDIYVGIKQSIFIERRQEIFDWHDDYYTSLFYSFLKSLEEFEEILAPSTEILETDFLDQNVKELTCIPTVVASTNHCGIPAPLRIYEEPSEEVYPGARQLGKDLQVIFTPREHIEKVKALVQQFHLEEAIKVESMDILEIASKIDQFLGPYFYDVYNLKKWKNQHKNAII